jgi:hypothetical protein
MRKFISVFFLAGLYLTLSCSQAPQPASVKQDAAVIEFRTAEHDFGTIQQGGDGTYDFVFKNTGKSPLILTNVRSSCGCTVPEWPRNPINKGEEAKIKVSYNTRITGSFSKSISVFSNAGEEPVVLIIKGKVEARKDN